MAFSDTYVAKGQFMGSGVVTKALDADNSYVLPHLLGVIPDNVTLTPQTGNEFGWMATWDDTNITITCSNLAGTGGSTVFVTAYEAHSLPR